MLETPEEISLECAKNYINKVLDLSLIKKRMASQSYPDITNPDPWHPDDLDLCEKYYKDFLFIAKKYPELPLVPSIEIDELWHNHILDTSKYMNDCQNIFGYYLHHAPEYNVDSNIKEKINADFSVVQDIFQKEFGYTL